MNSFGDIPPLSWFCSLVEISLYINAVPKETDFCVMAGTIEKFYSGLLQGAVGGVLSMANCLPDLCCGCWNCMKPGIMRKRENGISMPGASVKIPREITGSPASRPPWTFRAIMVELKAIRRTEGLL